MSTTPTQLPAARLAILAVSGLAGAILLPLPTYALTLACFGLPHVLAELRYVDDRFGARLPSTLTRAIFALLVAVVLVRTLAFTRVLNGTPRVVAELLLVAALAWCVVPLARRGAWRAAALGTLAGLAPLVLSATAPVETLVLLALLHNLTPVGFLAERLAGPTRRRALGLSALLFVGVPAAIVGLGLASTFGMAHTVARVGAITEHTRVFVPSFVPAAMVVDLFAAAVWLQVLHYIAVLGVLPYLGRGDAPRSPREALWPRRQRGRRILLASGIVSCALFMLTFAEARAFYGIAAAVHAWVEVPLLLAATGPGFGSATS